MTLDGDPRGSGEPHYFAAAVFTRLGRATVEPTCAACGKRREHPWHLREPRTTTAKMREIGR